MERIRGVLQAGYPYLALEEDGRIVGYCYAAPFAQRAAYRPSADLSLYLAPEAQQRGAGRALYECAMRLCRAQALKTSMASSPRPTPPPARCTSAWAFAWRARWSAWATRFGAWHGVCYYEKFLGAHDTPWRGLTPVGELDAGLVAETMRACAAAVRETPRELWELVDAQRRPTGVLHRRGDPLPEGLYHLVVDVLTVNPRGELLLTLRAAGKRLRASGRSPAARPARARHRARPPCASCARRRACSHPRKSCCQSLRTGASRARACGISTCTAARRSARRSRCRRGRRRTSAGRRARRSRR